MPVAPPVIVIQFTLLVAVHAQLDVTDTEGDDVDAVDATLAFVELRP